MKNKLKSTIYNYIIMCCEDYTDEYGYYPKDIEELYVFDNDFNKHTSNFTISLNKEFSYKKEDNDFYWYDEQMTRYYFNDLLKEVVGDLKLHSMI